jgi:hypothetical protein
MSARQDASPSKWARLEFPEQFRIGLEGVARLADWHIRRTHGGVEVATRERYENVPSALLQLRRIADASNATDPVAYAPFTSWPPQDRIQNPEIRSKIDSLREVNAPESATDAWVAFRLQFSTIRDAEVTPYLAEIFPSIVAQMATASLWKLDINPVLSWRVATARILFAAETSPEVLLGAASARRPLPTPMHLMQSLTFGLNAYVEPLLLPASPWIVGMNAIRVGGNAIVLFGQAQPGFSANEAAETLNLLQPRHAARSPVARPDFQPAVTDAWLRWWVSHVNDVLAIALDVGRFTGPDGRYRPAAQLGTLLSVERLFSAVQSILANSVRGDTRLWTFFDVIDLLDGLSFGSWETLLRPDKVNKQLALLEAELPDGVRDLALTRCRPAVAALNSLTDGFAAFPEKLTDEGLLRLTQRDGKGVQAVALTSAVPGYLRILRNATHSFREMARDPHDVSLLGSYSGDVPDAIADLAFFHLLRFLIRPRLPHD